MEHATMRVTLVKRMLTVTVSSLMIDEQGWCPAARQVASPNCDARAEAMPVDMVVIHNIHLPPLPIGATNFGGDDIERLFTNCLDVGAHSCYADLAQLRVSSHFLIRRNGELIQFVSCNQRAWHAGVSRWEARERCNDFSVGIELEGSDYVPFEAIQYEVLSNLLSALQLRYPLRYLVGHEEIAPERKTDPGPFFDWKRVEEQFGELRQSGAISNR